MLNISSTIKTLGALIAILLLASCSLSSSLSSNPTIKIKDISSNNEWKSSIQQLSRYKEHFSFIKGDLVLLVTRLSDSINIQYIEQNCYKSICSYKKLRFPAHSLNVTMLDGYVLDILKKTTVSAVAQRDSIFINTEKGFPQCLQISLTGSFKVRNKKYNVDILEKAIGC